MVAQIVKKRFEQRISMQQPGKITINTTRIISLLESTGRHHTQEAYLS